MKFLLVAAALVAAAGAMVVKDDILIGKDKLDLKDIKTKELIVMKLLNHILMPTMYSDIRDCAHDFSLENQMDMFLKKDVVMVFMDLWKTGMMLPRGEVFVHTNVKHMQEAIKVFHVLYFAKDFDTFIRTCCWMRDRINEGTFVYSLTVAVLHREDCRGIVLPAPYEIYPHYFVNSDVIHKVFMMKMKKGVVDPVLLDYYNIKMLDKKVVIDTRKDLRHVMTVDDRLRYFTEDIDLNTYFYYFHLDYPTWMTDDIFNINKERRGEIVMYMMQQLLARYRLERLTHEMCDIKPFMLTKTLKTGYWPRMRLHNGEEMPLRMNNVKLFNEETLRLKNIIDDMETLIRTAILTGRLEMRDGTVWKLTKPEDVEMLCRLVLGAYGWKDDAKVFHLMTLLKKFITYSHYNVNKDTYIPTSMDIVQTCLRDPVFWQLMKRLTDNIVLFKKTLPVYTRDELDFPGVKVENLFTDKLVTYMDEYDMDITNAVYLDKAEMVKGKSDMLFIARQRRLNHQPFKMTIEVVSEKAVDAVVRVFLGPKYDCMGRLINLMDKRLDMVEIDSFIYKLDTGKNNIVRDSMEMHNVLRDRTWTRKLFDHDLVETLGTGDLKDTWWHKARTGYPRRLLLPMGRVGGLEMTLYVIVTPVRTGMMLNTLDMDVMRQRKVCRFTVCMDTMPLGFPFDREIDMTRFHTKNMKFTDVTIFHKEMDLANISKTMDISQMVLKHDDFTKWDKDMLVKTRFMGQMGLDMDRMM